MKQSEIVVTGKDENLDGIKEKLSGKGKLLIDNSFPSIITGIIDQNTNYFDERAMELNQKLNEIDKKGKTIICFIGAPGAGKTTQIKRFKNRINPNIFHMSKFVKNSLGEKYDELKYKTNGELITGYENEFLDFIGKSNNAFNILDGFPRSEEQVIMLYEKALELGWNIKIVCLEFDEVTVQKMSLERQNKRSKDNGKGETDEKRRGKLKRYFDKDKKAILLLKNTSNDFLVIDANNDENHIYNQIQQKICINDLQREFNQDILKKVHLAEKESGIQMWIGTGFVYREYFNGKYGPIRDSFDVDIHIANEKDIYTCLEILKSIDEEIRWSVDSRIKDNIELYGIEGVNLEESLVTFPLVFRQAGIKLNENGELSIIMTSQAKYDLENGIIRIDENLLKRIPEKMRQPFIERSISRANKTLQEYPGLKLEGILKELYINKYGNINSLPSIDVKEIIFSIPELEFGGKQIWRASEINDEQIKLMEKVVDYYRKTEAKLGLVKYPKKSTLPYPWNIIFELKQKKERGEQLSKNEENILNNTYIPEGFESQLDYTSTLTDGEFKEWFFNQIRSRNPLGGKDSFISEIIEYILLNTLKKGKPTHLGLPLHIHSTDTVGQLKTDELANKLYELGYNIEVINSIRKCMRIGMFLHDIGKTKNYLTPGCHEGIGVKIWKEKVPNWINDNEKEIISWIILTHDIFGRLARSITEKEGKEISDNNFNVLDFPSYKGAIDPKKLVDMINNSPLNNYIAFEIAKEIWKADVSSVSTLNWILGISDVLFQIVEIEISKGL